MFDTVESRPGRREFLQSALAIGGTAALAACTELEGIVSGEEPRFPQGAEDLSDRPNRQHFWDDWVLRSMAGTTLLPQHQLILFFDYTGEIPPTDEEREQFEAAIQSVERAVQWGTGGDVGAQINEGLLFLIGYSPSYFDRFDESLPAEIDLPTPGTVLEEVGEDPSRAESFDAVMLLNADFASLLLEVEEALMGKGETVNATTMEANFEGLFELVERRTGFVGEGVPHENIDDPVAEKIDENAPMSMGFQSGFSENLPENDVVTFLDEPFKDGTTLMVSQLRIELDRWYDLTHKDRVELMFTTDHTEEQVGAVGENLGSDSGVRCPHVDNIEEDGREHGRIGHTAKTAAARDDDFKPLIHRRSESIATDMIEEGVVGFNFTSVQARMEHFTAVRKAMNPEEYDVDVPDDQHGIIDYIETLSRATFLVPPRTLRALPSPRPDVESYL